MADMEVARRTIVPDGPFEEERLAPGVTFRRLYPGALSGPNGETAHDIPGGQQWSESIMLGAEGDAVVMCVPDIRLPPNQIVPMHWHDCWTVVVVIDGKCLVGDWYMQPGDVFVAAPSVEYGPLLAGPMGCRLLEIFGDLSLSPGGYGLEYRDHPTMRGGNHVFKPREGVNLRNEGRSSLPVEGTSGMWKARLEPGWYQDLGEAGDPDRGVVRDTRLAAGETTAPRTAGDWYGFLVVDGSLEAAGRRLGRDDVLTVEPGATLPSLTAGAEGAQLLELARTARAI
jgi:hypothetical protein